MSDGRVPKGPLHRLIREYFGVTEEFDVCARVYGPPALSRSELAALSPLVTQAVQEGDAAARGIFEAAALEIAALVHAVRNKLAAAPQMPLTVSYCGGLMQPDGLLLPLFAEALRAGSRSYLLRPPRLNPALGAAVFAATLAKATLDPSALRHLEATADRRDAP